MLIAQISDCHIVEPGKTFVDRVDSAQGLRAAIDTIEALDLQPDLVLATGDLVNDGRAQQYDHLMSIVARLPMPVVPVVGNHDDRTELRQRFDLLPDGGPDDPIDYVIDDYPVRIVVLDTTIAGRHDGALDAEQLAWLDRELGRRPDQPTLVVQHHPPVESGIAWMDTECGFDGSGEALIVARHPQVHGVVAGHVHRAFHRRWAGTVVTVCPSTASPLVLEFGADPPSYTNEPVGLLLHRFDGNSIVSHVVPTGAWDRWAPSWQ